jgi:voltage-gated potassium channel Kch
VWGARALIAPVVWMSIMLLLVNVVVLIARLFGRIVPPSRRAAAAALALVRTQAARWSLNTPTALVQALLVSGVVALIVVTVIFRGLVDTFLTPLDTQPASHLVVLNTDHEDYRAAYRRSLEAVILLLGAGVIRVRRSPGGEAVKASALAGVAAVMLVALMLLIVPWRLMFQADFEEATLAGRRCFVLGESTDNLLLHCPDGSPHRNVGVARADTRLQRTGQISNLFDAYAAKRVTK